MFAYMWFHFFSLAIFAQVLILNGSFFFLFFTFSFHLKHQCTCCLGHLECWEICFSSAVFLKLLVWMLAPKKASQVLTHRRESHLPLCLRSWEVPWLRGVRSQLPFVNCLKFFAFLYIIWVLSTWVPGVAWGLNLLIYVKQSFRKPCPSSCVRRCSRSAKQNNEALLSGRWSCSWSTTQLYLLSEGEEICVTLCVEKMHLELFSRPGLLCPAVRVLPDVFPSPLQTGTRGTIPVVFYSNKELPVEWYYWASEHRTVSLLH